LQDIRSMRNGQLPKSRLKQNVNQSLLVILCSGWLILGRPYLPLSEKNQRKPSDIAVLLSVQYVHPFFFFMPCNLQGRNVLLMNTLMSIRHHFYKALFLCRWPRHKISSSVSPNLLFASYVTIGPHLPERLWPYQLLLGLSEKTCIGKEHSSLFCFFVSEGKKD